MGDGNCPGLAGSVAWGFSKLMNPDGSTGSVTFESSVPPRSWSGIHADKLTQLSVTIISQLWKLSYSGKIPEQFPIAYGSAITGDRTLDI
jgi:hypothetical protein